MTERIIIFDTTLRDGEQSPGMSMNIEEKIAVAEELDAMGVDVIEAGFAQASQGDFDAVREIAKRTKNAVVCSLARAKSADIERAAEALAAARHFRIHTFISTSDIHLKHQFSLTREEVIDIIRETVTLARSFTDNVEWSAMDATRSDKDYLCKAIETAIKAGASTVNIPDTVGYATPDDYGALIKYILNKVPNIDKAIISTHCQNDLGLATANSLAAIRNGARQIECTINGIGERAGNTALEEVVMAIKTRPDIYPFTTRIDATHITRVSKLVQNITGSPVQLNKAIVGANAFAHESGIHQDGVLKHAGTYEIMTPESVGLTKSSLVLGKHSGRHAFRERLMELGLEVGDNAFEEAFHRFKDMADKKKEIYDEDLIAMLDADANREDAIQLQSLHITCGTTGPQTAVVALKIDGEVHRATVEGSGPLDAAFKAIGAMVPHRSHFIAYHAAALSSGTDAKVEAKIQLELMDGRTVNGYGCHVDTVVASVLAYINALCKLQTLHAHEATPAKPQATAGANRDAGAA